MRLRELVYTTDDAETLAGGAVLANGDVILHRGDGGTLRVPQEDCHILSHVLYGEHLPHCDFNHPNCSSDDDIYDEDDIDEVDTRAKLIEAWREEAERLTYVLNRCASELELRADAPDVLAHEWLAEATTYRAKAAQGEDVKDNLALADAFAHRAYLVLERFPALV